MELLQFVAVDVKSVTTGATTAKVRKVVGKASRRVGRDAR
jgi:hypothetical protein